MSGPLRNLEPYRIVTDYDGLHEAFRDRVEDLDVPRLEIDVAAGLQAGYAAKLLATHYKKRFGPNSLGGLLRATGMALVVVIDDEGFAPIRASMATRKRPMTAAARSITAETQITPINIEELVRAKLSERIKEMRKSDSSSKRQERRKKQRARQARATHAARMRWGKGDARA